MRDLLAEGLARIVRHHPVDAFAADRAHAVMDAAGPGTCEISKPRPRQQHVLLRHPNVVETKCVCRAAVV
jgi:hypothetical protein